MLGLFVWYVYRCGVVVDGLLYGVGVRVVVVCRTRGFVGRVSLEVFLFAWLVGRFGLGIRVRVRLARLGFVRVGKRFVVWLDRLKGR